MECMLCHRHASQYGRQNHSSPHGQLPFSPSMLNSPAQKVERKRAAVYEGWNESAVSGCNDGGETVRVEEDKDVGESRLVFPNRVERKGVGPCRC